MKKLIPFIALLALLLALVSCNDLLPIDSESTDTGTVDTGDKPTPDDDFLLKLDELKKKNTGSTVGEADRSWQYYSHYKYVNVSPNEDFKFPDVSYAVKYSDKEISAGVKEINYAVGSYKIFYTYDEYARSAYVDKGDISSDMLGYGSGRAVVCIERKYDYAYGDEVALRNLAVIDGKTCIVLDRMGKGVTSSEPVTRVDFIYLDNSLDILKEVKPEGEIIVVDNVIETDATYDLCYELANKLEGDYYKQFDAVMSDELKTSLSSIETKEEFIPTKYWKYAGYWHGGVLTADYDVISNAGELLKFADNALKINASVFEDNVILLIRRREGSEWGENVGFKNLTVKDGEVYIVLDRYGGDLSSPMKRTYADFLIIPKDRLPDTVTKQGKIKVISNDFWIRDDETWDVIHDELRKENTEHDKLTEEVDRPWALYNHYDYINTYAKESYKMPEVPYAVKYFDKEISKGIKKIDYAVGSYDIFYSYEDYEKSAYADITPTGSDPFANEGDAVMCIKTEYDYTYGEEIAFRNLSIIEGKVCVVLDRVGTELASSEPATRVMFINLKKSDIPDGILKRGEITVVDNLIEVEEDIEFYRELAKGSDGYYEKLDSEAKAEIFGAIHHTDMITVCVPINYMKYYGDWAGYILDADYVTVSSVEELSALVSDTSGIDASIFDENVVLCLKRHYGSAIEHEAGFKNFTVKDGELYIAVDAKISEGLDFEESCEAYVDFIVIPKNEIPDTVSKEGKINVVSNETDYFDEEILQSYYEALKKRDPESDYVIGVEPGKEWLYYRHYDYVNTLPKKELTLPDVSYSVKYFDKEIAEGVSEINYAIGSYKIFYNYEEFSKSVYADMDYGWVSIKSDLENGYGAVICIERKYDYSYGEEMAFRNLTVIDGKVCIVLDRMDTEVTSSEPAAYVDFLRLYNRYIPEGIAPEGEIFIIDNRIETGELTDLCRELANKSDGEYYEQFEGEMTSELNSAIHELSTKKKKIPMQYWKYAGGWQGAVFAGKYEIVSSVEELSKLARDADKIDPSIFDDNVILCVERHENVVWGENIGFKNLTVKDGEIYIVLDRYCGDMAGCACWSYADFIIMPKDKIPEIMGTEGNINIISNDFYILDSKVLELKYEELKSSAWSDYYKIAGYHFNDDLKDVLEGTYADLTGTLRDVPIMIESDRTVGAYRAFDTYEQYEKAFKLEYKYQECNESIKPLFDDNVLVYIVGKYAPEDGGIEGFRNITWGIDDGATVVLDRNKCIRYYGDKNELCGIYIWVPRDEIGGYVNSSGRITILYDQTVPDEEIEYYRDLANKSGPYYESFSGYGINVDESKIVNYFAPLKYSMTYNIWYGRLTVTNYKIISDYASLSEYTVEGEIDETVFENNVLLYVERWYPSINGGDLGFRNFEVKDGQFYIVVDRAEGLEESDAVDPHTDFIVIPKEKLPEGVASEGTIKVINSIR